MITLNAHTSKNYSIIVTKGWQDLSFAHLIGKKVCIVSDSNVAPLYIDDIRSRLQNVTVFEFVIEAGEKSKNAQNYIDILTFLAEREFSRKDVVLALGGGVVGDLAGFVSATYMRGIDFYQIPTTLLAMIDSSVGGKTAIDLAVGKNLVGAFYQPSGVYINLDVLNTLPKVELDNGKGELVKYAFLSDKISPKSLNIIDEQLICDCLKVKIGIVEEDEKESGKRMLLNLGHTVGHAIETLSNYSLPHGICVAKGLKVAIEISKNIYDFDDDKEREMLELLHSVDLDLSSPYDIDDLITQMTHDKKTVGDEVSFVLVKDIGDCRIEKLKLDDLKRLV